MDVHCHVFDYVGNIEILKISYSYSNFDKADFIGIAPQYWQEYRFDLEDKIKGKKGVGEIGLDAKIGNLEDQEKVFIHQLEIAEKFSKPVQIHCRDCFDRILQIMSSYEIKALFHFFSGDIEHYKKIIDRGWYISIPPVPSQKRKKAIIYDPNFVLVESDSPYVGKSPEDIELSIRYAEQVVFNFREILYDNIQKYKKLCNL